ncbi:S49 family peptidase [Rubrobacter aplysinae]|uniref:S49 family peptidase n=1 Tax=Rubrobacter aplysinae TaxID=909625 RepID=UPI00064BC304|nr:S49 family peptidase [Rubrobacter aplysinae]
MSVISSFFANLWILLSNVRRSLGRAPEYVVIQVSGALPEFAPETGLLRRLGVRGAPVPPSLEEVRSRLRRISGDGRARGVILRVQELDAGWAALEELRREISAFRSGGGRVVVYLQEPDTRSYYMACAADEVLASPLSTVGVVGVGTRVNFLKDALDRIGAEAEVVAVSPYKSAGDTFTRNDFSPEAREQTERLVERRFESVISAISEGRSVTGERARELVDSAPYSAAGAVEAGLLDGAVYEDELPARLGDESGASVREWEAARKVLRRPYRRLRRGTRVGVVPLSGVIVRGRSRRLPVPVPFVGGEQAGSETVIGALRRAEAARSVGAVLFSVDSRGGDALASDLIWREVDRIRRKKPVVVLMGEYAASGGYYVSAAASRILTRRNTTTGSIGVVITRPVLSGVYGKAGITPVSVERGARAGLLDTTRRPDEDELSVLRAQLGGFYEEFKDRVARGRDMPAEDVEPLAGGRVWTGEEALDRGLVDDIGGFEDAVEQARELAGLDGKAGWIKIKPPRSARPSPGTNPAETLWDTLDSARDLRTPRTWTILPYELLEES